MNRNELYISRSTSGIKSGYSKAVSVLALNLSRNTMSLLIDGQKRILNNGIFQQTRTEN